MPRLLPVFPALFVLLWSTGFIGARYAMPHAEPFTFLALRFVLALVILVPLAVLARAPRPALRPALHAGFAGLLIHGLYLGGIFFAVRHGLSAGLAALIAGLQPLVTTLLASRFLGETIRLRHWLGLGLGLVGVGLVILPKLDLDPTLGWSTLAPAVLAMLAISVGTIWQKRFVGGLDLRVGTAIQYVGGLVPVTIGASLFETGRIDWTGEFVFALLWLTLVLSIGAIFLLLFLIREGAVSKVSSLMYLTPGVTAVMAFLLFGERLAPIQLLGMALAGIGVAAATHTRRPKTAPVFDSTA
ncbi:peptide ABC transporter ATP-binding protein [Aureimonas sp. Leaf454]|uniref:DMT family transporter n=1 Tax=Aureimonas sp. Leaf454 TaxID=1736381 RepID=UPI0006F794BE|nr:DMT family transporter [Aureimonas sp. Leaf454]KQT44422.1 peptide ABC transporter ATP-binding protein [Aureimonas sp. Leaf454]